MVFYKIYLQNKPYSQPESSISRKERIEIVKKKTGSQPVLSTAGKKEKIKTSEDVKVKLV